MWINRNKADLARLDKIQERAVRLIYNDKISSYHALLCKAAVPSVHTRWQRTLATEVFTAVKGISPSYIYLSAFELVCYALGNQRYINTIIIIIIIYKLFKQKNVPYTKCKSVSIFHSLINKYIVL